jgi:alkylation response protein AidB-like acyl-CoA dehydrogenase
MAVDAWTTKATRIATEVVAPHARSVDESSRWPVESISALAAAGLSGLLVPEEFGGAGASPTTFVRVVSTLAEQCASTAMIYLMHCCATNTIAQSPNFPARAQVLRDIAAGKHLSTLAFSEKGSRSHFWAPVSQALDRGEYHVLSAEKSWVTSAGQADSYLVATRSVNAAGPIDSTLYFVPRDARGMSVHGKFEGLGLRGNASAPMRMEGVKVPTSQRLTEDGGGFGAMMSTVLPWFQIGGAAVSLGISRAAVESIRGHLRSSKLEHLDQSLADLPNLRARLAQMQIAVDTAEAFLFDVCRRMETNDPATMLGVLQSKAVAGETALQVTDLAMRAGGGAAFSKHLSVERNFRDARAAAVMAPTTDVLHDFIGKALLEMPLF